MPLNPHPALPAKAEGPTWEKRNKKVSKQDMKGNSPHAHSTLFHHASCSPAWLKSVTGGWKGPGNWWCVNGGVKEKNWWCTRQEEWKNQHKQNPHFIWMSMCLKMYVAVVTLNIELRTSNSNHMTMSHMAWGNFAESNHTSKQLWFCITFCPTFQLHSSMQPSDHDGTYQTDHQKDYRQQSSTCPAIQGPHMQCM